MYVYVGKCVCEYVCVCLCGCVNVGNCLLNDIFLKALGSVFIALLHTYLTQTLVIAATQENIIYTVDDFESALQKICLPAHQSVPAFYAAYQPVIALYRKCVASGRIRVHFKNVS